MTDRTVLAIDPGSREFGFAVFSGESLMEASVKSLRRTQPKRSRLSVLNTVFMKLLANEQPSVIALEKNTFSRIPHNDGLTAAVSEMKRLAYQQKVPIFEFAPNTVKKAVTGDALATKRIVARALCAQYPQLKIHLEHKHLWQERYFLNMFDAVACGLTYLQLEKTGQSLQYAAQN